MLKTVMIVISALLFATSTFLVLREVPESNTEYTYIAFNLEWAPNVCQEHDCNIGPVPSTPTIFNIHGLWPTDETNKGPNFCKGEKIKFDYSKIDKTVQSNLIKFWNSLYNPQSSFIEHELEKHSTCWNPELGDISKMPAEIQPLVQAARDSKGDQYIIANNYLKIGMEMSQSYNLYSILGAEKIYPEPTGNYQVNYLSFALSSGLKVKNFKVECTRDEHGRQLLDNIQICFDLNFNLQECPFTQEVSCNYGETFMYVPRK